MMKKAMCFLLCLSFALSMSLWSCSSDRNIPNEINPITKPTPPVVTKVVGAEGISYAFTDLVFFDNQWFVTFRKSDKHIFGEYGKIQVYSSLDGLKWNFNREFSVDGIDLRDPKFSLNGNQLFLYIHGSDYKGTKLVGFSDYNSIYTAEDGFQELQGVYLDNLQTNIANIEGNEAWPWRVTWHKGTAYTVGYNLNGIFDLYSSDNGNTFKNINSFKGLAGQPNEATIRVDNNGEFFVLARRLNASTMIGRTFDPNSNWDWSNELEFQNFGGPNFVFTKENKMIVSGRLHTWVSLTSYDMLNKKISVLTSFNSKMDCGYPGMVIKGDYLWLSYYSAHENTTGSSIYVLKINLKQLGYN